MQRDREYLRDILEAAKIAINYMSTMVWICISFGKQSTPIYRHSLML